MTDDNYMAAIGTYSAADEDGVFTVEVDASSGTMSNLDSVSGGPDPTFVVPHPSANVLYVASREEDEGVVRAVGVDPATGSLNTMNSTRSGSLAPCYCSVDATGQFLFVAHYTGGAVSMLPIGGNGELSAPSDVVEHRGSGVHPERQNAPHPHSIVPGPQNRFVYVPDLGTDQIIVYEVERDERSLTPHAVADVPAGAGPRHLSFDPTGEHAYLINELDSTVVAFERNSDGTLVETAVASTVPTSFDGENKTAEIAVHHNGQFVFGSNRGHDSIVTFKTDGKTLSLVDHTDTGGVWPRHFAVSPDGRFLFVENKDSNEITAFEIDDESGALSRLDQSLTVPSPVCLQWLST